MAIAFVRQQVSTSITPTITAAATGLMLVVCYAGYRSQGARTITGIACTNTTGWAKRAGVVNGGLDVEIWTGYSTGTTGTTLTITMSNTGNAGCINLSEWSGINNAAAVDTGSGLQASGTSVNPLTPWIPMLTFGDLLIVCEGHADANAPAHPGGSFTALTASPGTGVSVQGEYYLPAPQGAQIAQWTTGNLAWVAAAVALKDASAPAIPVQKSENLALLGVG